MSELKESVAEITWDGPAIIKVKSVSRAVFSGLSSYPKSVTVLGCELSKYGYKTGLTPAEEAYYEGVLNLKKGDLNRHSKWWDTFNELNPIRLHMTKATEFVLDNPINQLRYKALLNNSKVAKTEVEKSHPGKLFYIDDAEAKAKAELETFNYEFEGSGLIHKLSPEEKRSTLRLFGKAGLDTMSETMLNNQLYQELKKDPKAFVETLSDKEAETKALIQELLEKKLLTRRGNHYYHGEDLIGHSTNDCVAYLNDVKNQPVKLALRSKLSKKSK